LYFIEKAIPDLPHMLQLCITVYWVCAVFNWYWVGCPNGVFLLGDQHPVWLGVGVVCAYLESSVGVVCAYLEISVGVVCAYLEINTLCDLVLGWCVPTWRAVLGWCVPTWRSVLGWCVPTWRSVLGWCVPTWRSVLGWCLLGEQCWGGVCLVWDQHLQYKWSHVMFCMGNVFGNAILAHSMINTFLSHFWWSDVYIPATTHLFHNAV
jgi:hypothetical protein